MCVRVCVYFGPLITELETCWHRPSMCLSDSGGNVTASVSVVLRYATAKVMFGCEDGIVETFFWGGGGLLNSQLTRVSIRSDKSVAGVWSKQRTSRQLTLHQKTLTV